MKTYTDKKRRKKLGEDKKINKNKRNEAVGTEKGKNMVKRKELGVASEKQWDKLACNRNFPMTSSSRWTGKVH